MPLRAGASAVGCWLTLLLFYAFLTWIARWDIHWLPWQSEHAGDNASLSIAILSTLSQKYLLRTRNMCIYLTQLDYELLIIFNYIIYVCICTSDMFDSTSIVSIVRCILPLLYLQCRLPGGSIQHLTVGCNASCAGMSEQVCRFGEII